MSNVLKPEVRAGWLAWNRPFEGRVATMYRDTDAEGWVTVGVGNLIDPVERALGLGWLREDGGAASEDEVRNEWARVKSMAPGLVWTKYRDAAGGAALCLPDSAIDALCMRQLAEDAEALAHRFPAFASFPAEAQWALCSMAWACGAGFAYPRLAAFVAAQDWAGCARECGIKGSADRSEVTKALFLAAAG